MISKFATVAVIALLHFLSAPAFSQGGIEIYDMFSPGERKKIEPNWKAIDARPLGTRENPVRAFQPEGEHAYLRRLICPGGSRPTFKRIGSFGPGPYTSILDGYEVKCGDVVHNVVIDMYHPGYVECRPVPGFSILGSCPGA
ncbi:MAG: hypothetical protein EPO55_02630 [Reyranella sp.]|uniref:hypothetical protein n=1 Tax=Reyranella sp. TaxID=1929291 RepID=UPI001223D95C|nr:hypothetical protein [Reyranella sp.]TAJ42150.1 MAG: hypothetical protein EPO55_02630 [Reyranella sp.]